MSSCMMHKTGHQNDCIMPKNCLSDINFKIIFQDTDAVAFALRLNGSKIAGRELRVMQCLPNPKKSVLERKKDKISFNCTKRSTANILQVFHHMIALLKLSSLKKFNFTED